jgi:hypothetical protein
VRSDHRLGRHRIGSPWRTVRCRERLGGIVVSGHALTVIAPTRADNTLANANAAR